MPFTQLRAVWGVSKPMPETSVRLTGIAQQEPLELWLGRALAQRYRDQDPIPENLRRLIEKLADSQAKMGCANREASAKIPE